MTELDVIKEMKGTGDCCSALTYDGALGVYLLGDNMIDSNVIESLINKELVYTCSVVQNSIYFDLTDEGKRIVILTEWEVIKYMAEADEYTATLAYDALIPGYCVSGQGRVSNEVFDSLHNKEFIYADDVICSGSVQLYSITSKGKEYYEKNK